MQNASDTAEDKIARQQDDLSVCAIATHAITAYVFLVVTADKVTASQVFTERTISENKAFGTYRVHSTKNGAYFNTAKLLIWFTLAQKIALVEAAGVEPASENAASKEPTYLVSFLRRLPGTLANRAIAVARTSSSSPKRHIGSAPISEARSAYPTLLIFRSAVYEEWEGL